MPFTFQIALGALAVAAVVGGFLLFESERLDKLDQAEAAQIDERQDAEKRRAAG